MKRRLIAALLMGTMLTGSVACGNSTETGNEAVETQAQESEQTTAEVREIKPGYRTITELWTGDPRLRKWFWTWELP